MNCNEAFLVPYWVALLCIPCILLRLVGSLPLQVALRTRPNVRRFLVGLTPRPKSRWPNQSQLCRRINNRLIDLDSILLIIIDWRLRTCSFNTSWCNLQHSPNASSSCKQVSVDIELLSSTIEITILHPRVSSSHKVRQGLMFQWSVNVTYRLGFSP